MNLMQWLKDALGEPRQSAVHIPDGPRTPPVRRRFRFSGRVQGVGFRYEAMVLAGRLELTGWAKNKSDGSVVVEVEGWERCIDEFLRGLRAVPRFRITGLEAEDLPPLGTETGFEALY